MVRSFFAEIEQKKYFLMFFTAVIYIAGLSAYFCDKAVEIALVLTVLGAIALLKNYLSMKIVLFWYFLFFFAFFNVSSRINNTDVLYKIAPKELTISGQVVSIPQNNGQNKEKFFFKVSEVYIDGQKEKIDAKTFVSLFNNDKNVPNLDIGNCYQIKGKLRPPFKVTNPSQFDYGKYLKNFNTFTVFYANSNDCAFQPTDLTFKWKFLQGLNSIRKDIIKTHSKFLKSPNIELLGGIIFGDDAVSPPDHIKKAFVSSGLLHILAASGMNVALIYGILFFILRTLKVSYKISVISGIFVIVLYTLMTGLGPSVIRAAIILIFVLLGKLIDRDAHSISLLSFVAILMLLYNPAYINDVGFQLSFIVTFGLLIMSNPVFERMKYIPTWLSGVIFVPVIAQIWVIPIQMYYFNSFSLYSVFANIFTLPFLTIVSFGGFISSVLAIIKPIANFVCMVFDFALTPFLNAIVYISNYFAKLPDALIQTPQPTILQIFFYYEAVILLTLMLKKGFSKKFFGTFVSTILVIIILSIHNTNKFEFITFDMQNADAFLLNAHGKYFIIDTGKLGYNGTSSPAKFIILEYLKDKGIKNIEGLILTHFDSDHAGGAQDVLENVNVNKIYVNSLTDKSNIAQNLYKKYPKKITSVNNNEQIFSDNYTKIKIYKSDFTDKKFENENSLITLVKDSDYSILMMGDAGVKAFNKIEKLLPEKIDILKVGHHGGKNVINNKMLNRLNPDFAIISTGLNNYGHPNPITLYLLNSHGIKTLRTDRNNAIKVDKNGVFTFSKEKDWEKLIFNP